MLNSTQPIQELSFFVESSEHRQPLDRILRTRTSWTWGTIRTLLQRGKVTLNQHRVYQGSTLVKTGAHVEVNPTAPRVDALHLGREAIVYVDPHIVVVRKPPGISTVPFDDEERKAQTTFDALVRNWLIRYAQHPLHTSLGVVHRIDKETSGLVVFARTFPAKRNLSHAFRNHTIERKYIAVVHGLWHRAQKIQSYIVANRGDGLRGSAHDQNLGSRIGQLAITHIRPIELLSETIATCGATLVECTLDTGRTHQIRIHASETNHPIVGDAVYSRNWFKNDRELIKADRLMLHAAVLGFVHPISNIPMRFVEPIPQDMQVAINQIAGRIITYNIR